MSGSSDFGLDASLIEAFTKNGGFGRLYLKTGEVIVLTLEGLYYTGRTVIEKVMNRNPYLVHVRVLHVPHNLDIKISFLEEDLVFLRHCPRRSILWEATNIYPFSESEVSTCTGVGR